MGLGAVDKVQGCHADCQPVGHLFENDGLVAIGDVTIDLDAAVDGAGVHDQDVGFGGGEAGVVDAEERGVFAQAWEHGLALALVLDAEEIQDIGVADGFVEVVCDAADRKSVV